MPKPRNRLLHETRLSIAISINLWVELVHERRLSVSAVGVVGASRSVSSVSAMGASYSSRKTRGARGARGMVCPSRRTRSMMSSRHTGAGSMVASGGVVASGHGGCNSGSNRLWLAGKAIMSLLTTRQGASLLLVVGHADSWQSRSGMMHCAFVVNFMHRNSRVYNSRLNGFCWEFS